MPNDTLIALVIHEAKDAIPTDAPIEARCRAAMRAAREHYMVTDPELQFAGAVGAVLESYGEGSPEWERIRVELGILRRFNAMLNAAQAGLSVNVEDVTAGAPDGFVAVGLARLWREVCDAE